MFGVGISERILLSSLMINEYGLFIQRINMEERMDNGPARLCQWLSLVHFFFPVVYILEKLADDGPVWRLDLVQ